MIYECLSFEPLYQEAKFIYYLGNLKVKPQVTKDPPASGVSQKGVEYVEEFKISKR